MARLAKSQNDRQIFGVCAGIAEHFGWDPLAVRLGFVALALAGGPGVLMYLVCTLVMPKQAALPPASY